MSYRHQDGPLLTLYIGVGTFKMEVPMSEICVYVLTIDDDQKSYLGSTMAFTKRFDRHMRDLRYNRHHCKPFQVAWNNSKTKLISVIRIGMSSREQAFAEEQKLLTILLDLGLLHNICRGAIGGDTYTLNPNKETAILNRTNSFRKNFLLLSEDEVKLKYGKSGSKNPMYGKTHTPEVRQKLREVGSRPENIRRLKNRKVSEETRRKQSLYRKTLTGNKNPFYGKTHSVETRALLSNKLKGLLPPNQRPVEINGVQYPSVTQASRVLKTCPGTIIHRIKSPNVKYQFYTYVKAMPND